MAVSASSSPPVMTFSSTPKPSSTVNSPPAANRSSVFVDVGCPRLLDRISSRLAGAGISLRSRFTSGDDTAVVVTEPFLLDRYSRRTNFVAVLSSGDQLLLRTSISAGARGLVLHDEIERDLVDAVRAAESGRGWISANVYDALIRIFPTASPACDNDLFQELTRREREVLLLMTKGLSTTEMSRDLKLSGKTVQYHVSNVIRKLGVRSRVGAVSLVTGNGVSRRPARVGALD